MWELGFAMALAKPTIVLTESGSELPFDIKDMQRIEYRRHHLSSTLGAPLQRMVIDTLACVAVNRSDAETLRDDNAELVGVLLKEMAQFKEIVAEAVHAWRNKESPIVPSASELESLCGHWLRLGAYRRPLVRSIPMGASLSLRLLVSQARLCRHSNWRVVVRRGSRSNQ